jgi:hypothetical protein
MVKRIPRTAAYAVKIPIPTDVTTVTKRIAGIRIEFTFDQPLEVAAI